MGSERKTGSWQTECVEETSGHGHSTECTRRQTARTGALSALFTAASLAPGIVTPPSAFTGWHNMRDTPNVHQVLDKCLQDAGVTRGNH